MAELKIQKRKSGTKFICGCCVDPFASAQNGLLVIISRHGSQTHSNAFTPAQLREIAADLEKEQYKSASVIQSVRQM